MSGAYWGSKVDFDGDPIPENYFIMVGEAANWTGESLRKRGISVSQTKEKFGTCRVYCSLTKDQIKDYQEVYAQAVTKNSRLKPAVICRHADFVKYLDRDWAKKFGFKEYGAFYKNPKCRVCGRKGMDTLVWDNDRYHQDFLAKYKCHRCKK